jgi:putative transposase
MPRIARIVIPGIPHHITQRGNNRQDVFFLEDDRRHYLDILRVQSAKWGMEVLAYCLMTNHVHLVAIPQAQDSLAKAIGRTNFVHTQAINRLHRRTGHLWQNRFYSCALDDAHLIAAVRYVERNPVRAKQAKRAWTYPWSSAAAHIGEGDPSGLLNLQFWRERWSPGDWRDMLSGAEDERDLRQLRLSTSRGRPLGSDSFLSKLERLVGRRLRPLAIGRPRKKNGGGSAGENR